MSLFGSKKKIYVASTVYKAVDDGSDRAPFIREVIAGTALSRSSDASFAEAIQAGIQNGPRANLKSFFRWCKGNYTDGLPNAKINYSSVIDDTALAAEILSTNYAGDPAKTINIVSSFTDASDEAYYAERWIMDNRASIAELEWAADYNAATNEITIQWPNGTLYLGNPIITDVFVENDFDFTEQLIIGYYTVTEAAVTSEIRLFIYVTGSGNAALDSGYIVTNVTDYEFYPALPLRIDNVPALDPASPAYPQRELIREAWKRAMGSSIDDAITQVNDNPDVGDIDYAYMIFGVCLNTSDIAEKKYLFEFFKLLGERQTLPSSAYDTAVTTNDGYGYNPTSYPGGNTALNQRIFADTPGDDFIEGYDDPTRNAGIPINQVRLTLPNNNLGELDMQITWGDISESTITGEMYPGAKVGEVSIQHGSTWNQRVVFGFENGAAVRPNPVDSVIMRRQISRSEYTEITIKGLAHKNNIYGGKSVDITAQEALADSDDSGFIVPLHEPTLKRIGAIAATDVARESYLMVFNSYQVVKKKWYQTGIFRFILAVVIVVVTVVITVVTAGAGTPAAASAGAGLLGSAAAVGAALGFSGLLAIAVGAAANAIAAMLVLQLVSIGATELFGEKIGAIITAVAAVALAFGTGPDGFSMSNFQPNLANLSSLDKLAMMTNAAADITGVIQQEQIDKILETARIETEAYEEELQKIEDLMAELGLTGEDIIDPMMLVDLNDPLSFIGEFNHTSPLPSNFGELPQQFLDRTLLTGSDMIELSNELVLGFVDATLTLQ